jgi:hypothetical protein
MRLFSLSALGRRRPLHAAASRGQVSAAAILAMLLGTSMCDAADSAPATLLKKLASQAGASSQDCGAVALPNRPDAAIACAESAASSGHAYRVAFQLQETDSVAWQGAVRDERGGLWVVFYDAYISSGAVVSPTLSVLACRDITYAVRDNDVLDCKPFTGAP